MRTFRVALYLSLPPLLALGCRTNPNQVLMERDLRLQEDRIYELEAMLDDCRCARETTIRENEALKRELTTRASAPAVEPPLDTTPQPRRSRPTPPASPEMPQIELPNSGISPPVESIQTRDDAAAAEGKPTQILVNRRLTGGIEREGAVGDTGILVAFELRDAEGRTVKSPGAVSVVVLDPAQQGEAARIARWNFTPEEIAEHFRSAQKSHGLQFELPWPGEAPRNRDLQLFVRYTTREGQKLTSESTIDVRSSAAIASAGREDRDWSPDGDRRIDVADASEGRGGRDRPVRQASNTDRPVWKPYR